jgi:hypothetical protein
LLHCAPLVTSENSRKIKHTECKGTIETAITIDVSHRNVPCVLIRTLICQPLLHGRWWVIQWFGVFFEELDSPPYSYCLWRFNAKSLDPNPKQINQAHSLTHPICQRYILILSFYELKSLFPWRVPTKMMDPLLIFPCPLKLPPPHSHSPWLNKPVDLMCAE